MHSFYVSDVRSLRQQLPRCTEHLSLLEQKAYTAGGTAVLRVLTWNVNILCGPESSAAMGGLQCIDPDLAAEVVREANADVVCLQEALDWVPPKYRKYFEKQGVGDVAERMQRLNQRLREQGYDVQLRSYAPPAVGNPVLLASRLPLVRSETLQLAVPEAEALGLGSPRSALYVELALASGRDDILVGLYATHLHHENHSPGEGQRAAEVRSLLRHLAERPTRRGRVATLLTGDLNQPRSRDYSAEEWTIVAAGLRGVKQPLDDGVHGLLSGAGFLCAYDAEPRPSSNFGGRPTPAFTHWTGTAVDYLYLRQEEEEGGLGVVSVEAAQVLPSDVSDHLPVAFDLAFDLSRLKSSSLRQR